MSLLKSWGESLSFFSTAFFKESLKILKDSYIFFFKKFWWLFGVFLALMIIMPFFPKIWFIGGVSYIGYLSYLKFIVQYSIYFVFLVFIFLKYIGKKYELNFFNYAIAYISFLILVYALNYAINNMAGNISAIIYSKLGLGLSVKDISISPEMRKSAEIFMMADWVNNIASILRVLFLYLPVVIFSTLDLLRLELSFRNCIWPFSSYPFCFLVLTIFGIFFWIIDLIFGAIFFSILQSFFSGAVAYGVSHIFSSILFIVFTTFYIAVFANLYKKLLEKKEAAKI